MKCFFSGFCNTQVCTRKLSSTQPHPHLCCVCLRVCWLVGWFEMISYWVSQIDLELTLKPRQAWDSLSRCSSASQLHTWTIRPGYYSLLQLMNVWKFFHFLLQHGSVHSWGSLRTQGKCDICGTRNKSFCGWVSRPFQILRVAYPFPHRSKVIQDLPASLISVCVSSLSL